MRPASLRPSHEAHRAAAGARGCERPDDLWSVKTWTVSRSVRRSRNWTRATRCEQLQTGEKTFATRVFVIGLGSSFSRSLTAKAAAVAPSSASTRTVGAKRVNARAF